MAKVIFNKVGKIFRSESKAAGPWWNKVHTQPQEVWAVKELNLEILDGEFLVLLGPSGCGKTTTLRMLSGLEELSLGEIYIGDRMVNQVPPKDRDIAMVFQNYALYPHMNIYENMAFGLKLRKFSKSEIELRVKNAAKLLELEPLLNRKPKELSGGQRQRVAMGRAIVRNPQVYLMDEPLSNLDAKLRVQMRSELQKIHQTLKVTTVYVTHDQAEAMTLGQRLVLMKEGLVQQVGPPLELYEKPLNQFVAGFLGTPSMNFIEGELIQDQGGLSFKNAETTFIMPRDKTAQLTPYLNRSLTLGIRPEFLDLFPYPNQSEIGIPAQIETIELMGNEAILHLNTEAGRLVARVAPDLHHTLGDRVSLFADLNKAHFFLEQQNLGI